MAAIKSDKNDPKERKATNQQVKEMKADLRSAHFHLGDYPLDYLSTAKQNLVNHDPKVSTEFQKLAHDV